jgi:hypothetical protein
MLFDSTCDVIFAGRRKIEAGGGYPRIATNNEEQKESGKGVRACRRNANRANKLASRFIRASEHENFS